MTEINERVSVLEANFDNMKETLELLTVSQKEHLGLTLQIKERFDKQNGAIPHMADDVKGIIESQAKILGRLNKDAAKTQNLGLKVKIVWSILAVAAGAMAMHFVKLVLMK